MCLLPISFANGKPAALCSHCVCCLPFFVLQGSCYPHLPLSMRKNPSIDSLLRTFWSIIPLLQVLVVTRISRRQMKLGKVIQVVKGWSSKWELQIGRVPVLSYISNLWKLSPCELHADHPPNRQKPQIPIDD